MHWGSCGIRKQLQSPRPQCFAVSVVSKLERHFRLSVSVQQTLQVNQFDSGLGIHFSHNNDNQMIGSQRDSRVSKRLTLLHYLAFQSSIMGQPKGPDHPSNSNYQDFISSTPPQPPQAGGSATNLWFPQLLLWVPSVACLSVILMPPPLIHPPFLPLYTLSTQ